MTAPAREFLSDERYRRQKHCTVCGTLLEYHGGRPRLICGASACANRRKYLRQHPESRYTPSDRAEAIALWEGHCAACLTPLATDEDGKPHAHFVSDIVPVHYGCAERRLRPRVWAWLSQCKAFVPLPTPDLTRLA
jgi:hypothetical protein